MCYFYGEWEEFKETRKNCVKEDRVCMEPDDEDVGSGKEKRINLKRAVNFGNVQVLPFLSTDGRERGDAKYLDEWFDELAPNDFYNYWKTYEKEIKALVRYPGGYHEWLMVSTLPELKAMGVPMWLIKKMIIPTSACFFYVNGEKCWHGKRGSGAMHRDLFKAIVMTFYEAKAFDGKYYVEGETVNYAKKLRANLTAFFMVYYPEEDCFPEEDRFPEEVREFLEVEGYAGE